MSSNSSSSAVADLPRTHRGLVHLAALDGLRGIAIVMVLAHNFATVSLPGSLAGRVVELALDIGWIGVQLFFVLSGFLITRILLQTQDSPNYYRAFFGRRVLRIFPLYYGALFVAFVAIPFFGGGSAALAHDREHQVWLWLYLSNWAHAINFESQLFPHFWSLAIEEQFYLLWPILLYKRSARAVLMLCAGVAVLSLGLRIGMLQQGADVGSVYTYTVCRMDALALGAAVAAWLSLPRAARSLSPRRVLLGWGALGFWVIGLVLTRGYPRTSPIGQTLGYSWLAIAFAWAVFAVVRNGGTGPQAAWELPLKAAPLRALGKYSYGMYVFHKPLHDGLGRPLLEHFGLLKQPSIAVALSYVVIATLATLFAAVASYHLFEKYFLSLKRLFTAQAPARLP